MEEKKRTLLAVAISCIILVAVAYSFGLNFLGSTPEIVVADPAASASQPAGPGAAEGQAGILVEVTPQTVQSIIASMSRYKSYRRSVEIRYSWTGGVSQAITAQVMVDGSWSRCDATLASGMVEHSIVGGDTLWYWYDESEACLTAPASQREADLIQRIPTYEDVLLAETAAITATSYEEKDDTPCIFVEVARELGYVDRYWISVTSGLLTAAETEQDGEVVYSMTSGDVVSPLSGGEGAFTLPDGTALYGV